MDAFPALLFLLACYGVEADLDTPALLDSGIPPGKVEERPFIDYARECINLLMQHGTDRYGEVQSPILMSIIDVRTRTCPANPPPLDEKYRVSRRGRRGPGGANLYLDQPLLRSMILLSSITGREEYRRFAAACAHYHMKHLKDENGLFWWGYHRHYDAHRDIMTGHQGNWHEIHIQQALWPFLFEVNREAVVREIEAIWALQVIDKETGEINRHSDGKRGCDFAMTGGEIIRAFAFLYAMTREPKWLDRARLVANYYWNARHPESNLIPNRPNAGKERFDGWHFDTSITGLLCLALLEAHALTKEPMFRDQAVAYLAAYARAGYDLEAKRFFGSLQLDGTPAPGPRGAPGYGTYEPRGHIDMWEPYIAGYEFPIYTAQAYAYGYELTQDKNLLAAATRWAACIQETWPPRRCNEKTWYGEYAVKWAPRGTYAGLYGRTISFHLHLHALTGDEAYLAFARAAAQEAVSKLYYKGLFRGHPCKPYYEAADGVGYLLCALIQLDRVLTGVAKKGVRFENR
jgi:hypothetical protein